jgi:cellulose biosynthesis protein BcsQ
MILAFAMQKGGVGKTTTTLAVGVELAQLGKRVLLVDTDPQSNLTQAFGNASPHHRIIALLQRRHHAIPSQAQ